MDRETLSVPFIQGPIIRKLVSIDSASGEVRSYAARDGEAPKLEWSAIECPVIPGDTIHG